MGLGEEDVEEVGEEEGPCYGDCANEEEGCKEEGHGERVGEDDEGLEAALERDGERGEVDAGGGRESAQYVEGLVR